MASGGTSRKGSAGAVEQNGVEKRTKLVKTAKEIAGSVNETRTAAPCSVSDIQSSIEEDANDAVKKFLPAKIVALDKLCTEFSERLEVIRRDQQKLIPSSQAFGEYAKARSDHLKAIRSIGSQESTPNGNSKKRRLSNQGLECTGSPVPPDVPMNEGIFTILKDLTNEVLSAIELLGKVKTWIQLKIPKIETGNNFGVAVQEECVGELHRVEDAGFTVLESTTKYHQRRARLSHKLTKHPLLHDYRQAMLECDDVECDMIKLTIIDLRNSLFVLHDMLAKNFEKILKPRSENSSVMMY